MIASAIADSISRWCRSAIRWRAPTYLTAARPTAVESSRLTSAGTTLNFGTGTRLVGVKIPPGSVATVLCETSA